MKHRILFILLLATAALRLGVAAERGFVSVQGPKIVAPGGAPLLLRGINLGNWLVPEGYMPSS